MTDPRQTPPLPPPADPWSETDPAPHARLPYGPTSASTLVDHGVLAGPGAPAQVIVIAPEKRRRWPWVLTALLAVGALCCGGLAALTAPMWQQHPSSVRLGDSVAGLQRIHTPEVDRRTDELVRSIRQERGVEQAFAGIFADPDHDGQVIIFGATLFILDPRGVIDQEIQRAGDDVATVTTYDSGALGGEVRCGDARDGGTPVVVCAWIDHGSVGVAIFTGDRTQADSADLFLEMRGEILHRD